MQCCVLVLLDNRIRSTCIHPTMVHQGFRPFLLVCVHSKCIHLKCIHNISKECSKTLRDFPTVSSSLCSNSICRTSVDQMACLCNEDSSSLNSSLSSSRSSSVHKGISTWNSLESKLICNYAFTVFGRPGFFPGRGITLQQAPIRYLQSREFVNQKYVPELSGQFDDEDEGTGWMTEREKEWVIKIQQQQIKTENPYMDDYYFYVSFASIFNLLCSLFSIEIQ